MYSRPTLSHPDPFLGTEPLAPAHEEGRHVGAGAYSRLTGKSPSMQKLFTELHQLENSRVTVLIEGESGTGKELVARAVHERSPCSVGPWVVVNCGGLDRGLARSELFGHRRGAFTGAIDSHGGAFEAARGGTLFLDEIGELSLDVQPLLLRALESRSICRVGDATERETHVRVIAATNRDLAAEVRGRRFREDLFFRLSVVLLRVPPLRERQADIELLAYDLGAELGLSTMSQALLNELRLRPWHGNVRELRNALQYYCIFGRLPDSVPSRDPWNEDGGGLAAFVDPAQPYAMEKNRLLRWFQAVYFRKLLVLTNGNKTEAARLAGVERSYLSKTMKALRDLSGGDD